jgi:2-hydroxy-6-oxo-6-(2'-carboxyphenyl)-hexa-2,4-dienoate hydrolase
MFNQRRILPTAVCLVVCLALPAMVNAASTATSNCDLDLASLDRGERRVALLCGAGLSSATLLNGISEAGIAVLHRQDLRRCTPEDRRPGLLLELEAGAAATSTTLKAYNPGNTGSNCEVSIQVPERLLLNAEPLVSTAAKGIYAFTIRGKSTYDLTPACTEKLIFTASDGPKMELAGLPVCSKGHLSGQLRITAGPQQPAKFLLSVRNAENRLTEAIAYLPAPAPYFATTMAEADARYVVVRGIRTRYFEKGSGETLILVHGGQPSAPDFSAWEWQQNFDGLAENFRVIALDKLGQGYTDSPANLDDYDNYYSLVVAHLAGFLDALNIDKAHLVGHSQGAYPVTRLALDYPQRIQSVTVVDSTMIGPVQDASQAARFYIYQQNELHPESGPTLQSIQRGMAFFSYTNNYITEQRIARIYATAQTANYQEAHNWFTQKYMSPAHPSFRKLKDQMWHDLLNRPLKVPMLIVWGRQDPEGSFNNGLNIYTRLYSAGLPVYFHIFDNAGHVAYMEYPTDFNRLIARFTRGNGVFATKEAP